jgi:DNA/RNA endonuclease YhcR with UshA esterase domain
MYDEGTKGLYIDEPKELYTANDGVLYTRISASMPDKGQRQRLMPFLGKYVQVTGEVFERTGTHAIVINEIHEVKNVHLITNAE